MTKIEINRMVCTLAVIGVLLLSCGLSFAQKSEEPSIASSATRHTVGSDQYLEVLSKDIRSMRKQIVAANLELTDDQLALIKDYAQNYGSMTDEQAVAYVKGSGRGGRSREPLESELSSYLQPRDHRQDNCNTLSN